MARATPPPSPCLMQNGKNPPRDEQASPTPLRKSLRAMSKRRLPHRPLQENLNALGCFCGLEMVASCFDHHGSELGSWFYFITRITSLQQHAHTPVLSAGDLEALSSELHRSDDVHKLSNGIILLGDISLKPEPIGIQAFHHLLTMLAHQYPKVRNMSAEHILLALHKNSTLVPEDNFQKAFDIIADTCWGGDIEEAKRKSLEVRAMCNQ